jgi:hypothetical protein
VWGNGSTFDNRGTNTVFKNNLTTDPGFVNATAADFRLKTGSLAINGGVNLYSLGVTKDFAGASRPQTGAFDVGAYEFGTGDSNVPAAPLQFAVN